MKKTFVFVFSYVCIWSGISASGETPWPDSDFIQKEFVLSAWGDMPMDEHAQKNYADMADAHFNVVLNFFVRNQASRFGGGPGHIEKQLDVAQQNGMEVLVYVGEKDFSGGDEAVDSLLTNHPACMGYFLYDEPPAERIPAIADQARVIRQYRPDKLVYVNLFPNGGTGVARKDYDKYLDNYVIATRADVLSADFYPEFRPGGEKPEWFGPDVTFENLAALRKVSLKHDIPFWWFLYSTPHLKGKLPEPTGGQLRWQAYMAVTYGAKGILYFTYWHPPFASERFHKDSALVDSRYTKNRLYDKAKRLNFCLSNLGPTLMRLRSTDVIRVQSAASDVLDHVRLSKVEEHDPDLNLVVGVFKHEDARDALMLTNYEHAYTTWVTLELDDGRTQVVEISQDTGEEVSVYDESPKLEGIQISLDSGEGRLFLLSSN